MMQFRKSKQRLSEFTIVMPLNVPVEFPSDYIRQTASVLQLKNSIILFDFRYPISIFSLLRNAQHRQLFIQNIRTILSNKKKGEIFFRPIAIIPYQRIHFIYTLNVKVGIFTLRWLLAISNRKNIILWGFHPLAALLLGKLRETLSIYDCVDYYGQEILEGNYLRQLERKLTLKASLLFFNSYALYAVKIKEYGFRKDKAEVVPCGCNIALFSKTKTNSLLSMIPKPRIGLIGHLNYRVDYHLLRSVIRNNPQWSFVIVGPVWETQLEDHHIGTIQAATRLESYKNVYFLGKIQKKVIPSVVSAMDVCIIPYNTKFSSVRYCNPMKAYEYLASGKPVVSTPILPLQEIKQDIVKTTNDANEFTFSINYFLENWNNKMTEIAVKIAKQHSWLKKLRPIELRILNQIEQIHAVNKIKK